MSDGNVLKSGVPKLLPRSELVSRLAGDSFNGFNRGQHAKAIKRPLKRGISRF